jgi:hypothetical protein
MSFYSISYRNFLYDTAEWKVADFEEPFLKDRRDLLLGIDMRRDYDENPVDFSMFGFNFCDPRLLDFWRTTWARATSDGDIHASTNEDPLTNPHAYANPDTYAKTDRLHSRRLLQSEPV